MSVCRFAAAALFASLLTAQTGSGAIDGAVVNAASGEPVKKAAVNAHCAGGATYNARTDPFGKFHFGNVQPGTCYVVVQAEGFSQGAAVLNPVTVEAGDQAASIRVQLTPAGAIAGKVTDDAGEPIEGANVTLRHYVDSMGTRTLQPVATAQTNDRGEYRLFMVVSGRYFIAASAPNRTRRAPRQEHVHSDIPEEGFAELFYPGVPEVAQAAAHRLKPGEEWTGVDFKLRKQPLYHIRGRIDRSTLPSGSNATVQAARCDDQNFAGAGGVFDRKQDGAFDLAVVPGSYCLTVREQSRGGLVALTQPVTVKDGDVGPLTLTPLPPFSVKGSITFEGTAPEHFPPLGIGLRSLESGAEQRGRVGADMTFEIADLYPGKYAFVAPEAAGWYAKSITCGGQDVSDGIIPDLEPGASISMRMARDTGEIDVNVQSGSLPPGAPVVVIVFRTGGSVVRFANRRVLTGRVGATVSLSALPPWDYKVFALEGLDFQDAEDPDLLKLLEAGAATVTVHPNGHETAAVTAIPVAEMERAWDKIQ